MSVNRNDISLLAGRADAAIHGPDSSLNAVAVTGDRFVLDGLTVTGGRNAVVVSGGSRAMIRNCVTRGGGSGVGGGIRIAFFQGANGTVDNCQSTGNPNDGLLLDAAIATITNSTFMGNGRAGILVFSGTTARIGMTNFFAAAGNVIKDNGSAGIHVTLGSMAIIVGNEISGNGANPAGPFGPRQLARRALPGHQGVPEFDARLEDATVEKNNGTGVALSARSTMNVVGGTNSGHSANGIQLSQGSAAIFQTPGPVVNGNAPFDLQCLDGESSYQGVGPGGATGIAAISPTCTGF